MATLVVVGNAAPRKDYSTFIDDSDVVFRFNFTPFYSTAKTGRRTTVLCLFGVPYPQAGEVPQLNRNVVASCRSIWVESEAFLEPLMTAYGVPREKITLTCLRRVPDVYAIHAQEIRVPSSGFQVLRYLVNSRQHASMRKYICGFEWRGGGLHCWEMEKAQFEHYRKLDLLERLDG